MNENTKTLTFVGAAIVVLLVAVIARPKPPAAVAPEMQGKTLFEAFNPLDSTRLEILEVSDTGDPKRFEVAQVNGRWQIPSHEGYPTDAKDQLSQAAGNLTNLTALQVVSDAIGDHTEYGVLDPQGAKSAAGVGKRVMLRGKDDKPLVQLIIGKEVPDRPGLHYVRRAGEDQVYIVDVKTDKLSTKFEDWIEKDLLKISSWDMKAVKVRDYALSIVGGRELAYDPRAEIALNYSDTDPKWTVGEFRLFNRTKKDYEPSKLADDQELNASKLDTMKSALDDLKIVDVQRKPAGLSANLKVSGDLAKADNKAAGSLINRGFYPVPMEAGVELMSTKGDMRVLMKDGVQYVLRFGEIAGADEAQKKDAKKDDKKSADKKDDTSGGVTRYLLVMAEFNPDAIEKPKLDPLPEEKKEADKKDEKKEADKKPAEKKADKEADKKEKDKKAEELKAERERVEKENKRKQDEYNDKIKKGEDRVKELNGRFADWYYVISEDVYKRIHLTREDIIKKKEKKDDKKDEKKADPLGKDLMQPLPGAQDDHAGHDHAAEEKKDAADKPAQKDAATEKPAPEKKGGPAADKTQKKDAPAEKKDGPAASKDASPEKADKKDPPKK